MVRYSPQGKKLLEYSPPPEVRAISSVTFGGPDYKTVFVTTANYPDDVRAADFRGEGVFALHQKIAGVPEFQATNH